MLDFICMGCAVLWGRGRERKIRMKIYVSSGICIHAWHTSKANPWYYFALSMGPNIGSKFCIFRAPNTLNTGTVHAVHAVPLKFLIITSLSIQAWWTAGRSIRQNQFLWEKGGGYLQATYAAIGRWESVVAFLHDNIMLAVTHLFRQNQFLWEEIWGRLQASYTAMRQWVCFVRKCNNAT